MVRKLNKKGSLDDMIFIIISLLVLSMFALLGFKIVTEFNTKIDASGLAESYGTDAVDTINNIYPTTIDNGMLFLLIGLLIISLVLASLVVIHPVFLVFYCLMIVFVIFFGGVASNVYQEMANHPDFIELSTQLLWTSHIMQYLPIIIGVFGFVLAIIMYKAWENRQ